MENSQVPDTKYPANTRGISLKVERVNVFATQKPETPLWVGSELAPVGRFLKRQKTKRAHDSSY
jgi:hypothetical protein